MMEYELISADDFDELPEDADAKFVALEHTCRRNLNRVISQCRHDEQDDSIFRMQYMTIVAAAAAEVGIQGLTYPGHEYPTREFDDFMMRAIGEATRIRMRQGGHNRALSVKLSNRTKGRIELEVRRLQRIIEASDLPKEQRAALISKLLELSSELERPRLSFGKAFAILAYVGLGITNGTSFLADAPNALATITSLIGADKKAEDDEARRLGPPAAPKALPPPTSKSQRSFGHSAPAVTNQTIDDDIPF